MVLDKENCLTVADLLRAIEDGRVRSDDLICHAIPHFSAGLTKITGVAWHPDGALVFTTDHRTGCANDPDNDIQKHEQII